MCVCWFTHVTLYICVCNSHMWHYVCLWLTHVTLYIGVFLWLTHVTLCVCLTHTFDTCDTLCVCVDSHMWHFIYVCDSHMWHYVCLWLTHVTLFVCVWLTHVTLSVCVWLTYVWHNVTLYVYLWLTHVTLYVCVCDAICVCDSPEQTVSSSLSFVACKWFSSYYCCFFALCIIFLFL